MQRRIIIWLLTYGAFLFWLYMASNHSLASDWWSVKKARPASSHATDVVALTPVYRTSLLKVFIGGMIFWGLGALCSKWVGKKSVDS